MEDARCDRARAYRASGTYLREFIRQVPVVDGRLTDDDEEEQEKEDRADRVKVPDDPVVLSGHVNGGWLNYMIGSVYDYLIWNRIANSKD